MSKRYVLSQAFLVFARYFLVGVAVASSLLSIGLFMAAIGDNNLPLVSRLLALYFVSAFVIGACVPRWWCCAMAVAWLPLLMLPGFLSGALNGQTFQQSSDNQAAALLFVCSPLVALAAGYIGSWFSRLCAHIAQRSQQPQRHWV